MNFLKETKEGLKFNGKTIKDIEFIIVGARNRGDKETHYAYIDKEEFFKNIDFEYDNGYGGENISLHCKIVGKYWWLERHEYDGSEWWEYKELPVKPTLQVNHKFIDNDYDIQDELKSILKQVMRDENEK